MDFGKSGSVRPPVGFVLVSNFPSRKISFTTKLSANFLPIELSAIRAGANVLMSPHQQLKPNKCTGPRTETGKAVSSQTICDSNAPLQSRGTSIMISPTRLSASSCFSPSACLPLPAPGHLVLSAARARDSVPCQHSSMSVFVIRLKDNAHLSGYEGAPAIRRGCSILARSLA